MPIKRALISLSDKSNLIQFAQSLINLNIEILATGGTAKKLAENNITFTTISEHTGFPEIMDGRVKTLHPTIHAGILARRGIDDHTLAEHNIKPIDLIVVNLYPFAKTIASPDVTLTKAIENIDIGGPTMLRAAAKNHEYVTVVTDPNDYNTVIAEIKEHGDTTLQTRRFLAQKVFSLTAEYNLTIANYLDQQCKIEDNPHKKPQFPEALHVQFQKGYDLRYGENPHQAAAFYRSSTNKSLDGTLANARLLQGKPLSYNNMIDADAALACAQALDTNTPSCVIVKHATPCGVSQSGSLHKAYKQALATDPISAFGGIIAFNQCLDRKTSEAIIDNQFVEVIIAPEIDDGAKQILLQKKNCRVLETGHQSQKQSRIALKTISGGLLVQSTNVDTIDDIEYRVVTKREPTQAEMTAMKFGWHIIPFIKSNAILYTNDHMTLGIGTGQTSRVFSAEIASLKAKAAGLSLKGAAMASDAFFPFADTVEIAAKSGITAIIQPGGSKRDPEVIAKADELNLTMVMTGVRHFLH